MSDDGFGGGDDFDYDGPRWVLQSYLFSFTTSFSVVMMAQTLSCVQLGNVRNL